MVQTIYDIVNAHRDSLKIQSQPGQTILTIKQDRKSK